MKAICYKVLKSNLSTDCFLSHFSLHPDEELMQLNERNGVYWERFVNNSYDIDIENINYFYVSDSTSPEDFY